MSSLNPDPEPETSLPEMDPTLMAQMGFSSFGTQKKPSSSASKNTHPTSSSHTSPLQASHGRNAKRQKRDSDRTSNERNWATGPNDTPVGMRRVGPGSSSGAAAASRVEGDAAVGSPGYVDSDSAEDEDAVREDVPTTLASRQHQQIKKGAPPDGNLPPPTHTTTQDSSVPFPGLRGQDEQAFPPGAEGSSFMVIRSSNPDHPPPIQRLENGDMAFFLPSFIENPWEGLQAVQLSASSGSSRR